MVSYLSEKVAHANFTIDYLDCKASERNARMRFMHPDEIDERTRRSLKASNRQAGAEFGYALDPQSLPRQILWRAKDKQAPDVLPGFVVSARFRELVERLEGGVHQFVPVALHRQKHDPAVAEYYWFVVCQRIRTVDPKATTWHWDEGGQFWTDLLLDRQTMDYTRIADAKLVYSESLAKGAHIWADPSVLTFAHRLCSESFAREAEAKALTGLTITPRETV
ncbi:MAG: imm11 family protein [Novosphingobium sp.]